MLLFGQVIGSVFDVSRVQKKREVAIGSKKKFESKNSLFFGIVVRELGFSDVEIRRRG